MADPSIAVQGSILTRLKASPAVTAIVAQRIFDYVPSHPSNGNEGFPYLRVDITQSVENDDYCGRVWEVFVSIHAWSRAGFRAEAFNMISAVRQALDVDLPLINYRTIEWQFLQSRTLDDPDGITTHAVVDMRYLVSAP